MRTASIFFTIVALFVASPFAMAAPDVDKVMQNLRMLGIEETIDTPLDEAGLRSIAEDIMGLTQTTLSADGLLTTFRGLMTKRFIAVVTENVENSINLLPGVQVLAQTHDHISIQELNRIALALNGLLQMLKQLPPELKFASSSPRDAQALVQSLKLTLNQIELFTAKPQDRRDEERHNLSIEPLLTLYLNTLLNDLRRFLPQAGLNESSHQEHVQSVLFSGNKILKTEYSDFLLDCLESEEDSATLKNMTRQLLYFVATQDDGPSLKDDVKKAVLSRWKSLAATTGGALFMGEMITTVLGQAFGEGILLGSAARLILFGAANARSFQKWQKSRELWIFNALRSHFNLKIAAPLGINASAEIERFKRMERLVCGSALESARQHL